ncbi:MAG: hydrogenase maturation protease [Deltaproteobacteria bacterium]|nr:hydrogenase maturation protease [Deltaproteobacteria bacterium]
MLVIAIGNPSRGDDALGPLFLEAIARETQGEVAAGAIELLTDFQLQIEHALDIEGRERVCFVDAAMRLDAPFELRKVSPALDDTYTSHAMSPGAVLETCRRIHGSAPEAWVLAIGGEAFELGEGLSARANRNLSEAVDALVHGPLREVLGLG